MLGKCRKIEIRKVNRQVTLRQLKYIEVAQKNGLKDGSVLHKLIDCDKS